MNHQSQTCSQYQKETNNANAKESGVYESQKIRRNSEYPQLFQRVLTVFIFGPTCFLVAGVTLVLLGWLYARCLFVCLYHYIRGDTLHPKIYLDFSITVELSDENHSSFNLVEPGSNSCYPFLSPILGTL